LEDLLFYWFSWILWVIVTFFFKKTRARFYLAVWILIVMIVKPLTIPGIQGDISLAYIFLTLGAMIWIGQTIKWHHFLSMITMTSLAFLYAALQLSYWFSPVIFLIHETWLVAVIMVFVTLLVVSKPHNRVPWLIVACCIGNFWQAVVVSPLTSGLHLGFNHFFNDVSAMVILLVAWHVVERLIYEFSKLQKGAAKHQTSLTM